MEFSSALRRMTLGWMPQQLRVLVRQLQPAVTPVPRHLIPSFGPKDTCTHVLTHIHIHTRVRTRAHVHTHTQLNK